MAREKKLDSIPGFWYNVQKLRTREEFHLKCPYCGDQESKVVDSRRSEDGLSIRRRRECMRCLRRFTTYEIVESLPIIVV